jgi:hypothetical protein
MDDAAAGRGRGGYAATPMDEYKRHLRRLAVHDDALLDELAVEGRAVAPPVLDDKTVALLRIAATVAVDAAPYSFQHAVALALGSDVDAALARLDT